MKSDILIVDDTPANLTLLSDMLKEKEYKVRAVPSGKLALSASKNVPPDLILLDINMPNMNGYEVCSKLKEDEDLEDIPVLFISALSDMNDKIEAFKKGGVDYITKPFHREEVLARVETHLKITHLVKAQKGHLKQIQSDYQKLKDLESMKDGLIHMIIHDMRSPLFGISAYLELLKSQSTDNLSSESISYIDTAYTACKILGEMINSLLDINKMENNALELKKEKCKILDLINESTSALNSLFKKSKLNLSITQNNTSLFCDKEIIKRVISNLISNSIKFTPNGGKIEIDFSENNDGTTIYISDTGNGIPEKYRDKIFDKFTKLENKSLSDIPSTGLGLTFCKMAIEAHGGHIGVKPGKKTGSCFWFKVPSQQQG